MTRKKRISDIFYTLNLAKGLTFHALCSTIMPVNYFLHILTLIVIFALLAAALNFAIGGAGLINFAHVAFFGIGAYTSALLVKNGSSYLLALFGAILLPAICGAVLAFLTRRFSGDYLALATTGFHFLIAAALLNWSSLTNGALGLAGITRPSMFGWIPNTQMERFLAAFAIVALGFILINRLWRSRFGLALGAVRDDELALAALGKNPALFKMKALAITAALAGAAGSIFAHYLSFIDPWSFALTDLVFVISITVVGGLGSLKGTALAAFLLFLIPESLRFLSLPSEIIGPFRQIAYALILILALIYRPRGFYGSVELE